MRNAQGDYDSVHDQLVVDEEQTDHLVSIISIAIKILGYMDYLLRVLAKYNEVFFYHEDQVPYETRTW